MSTTQNIPIVFENLTGKSDFQEIIFAKDTYIAWTVIQTQSSAQFEFTAEFSVQSSYEESGITYTQGPFVSKTGTNWELVEKSDNEVILQETKDQNPNEQITVKNKTKIYFSIQLNNDGRKYYGVDNVGPEVVVSFLPRPDITFAVATKQIEIGETFKPEDITDQYNVNLASYPQGVKVSLSLADGKYVYSTTAL